jgi:hypothetical protein
LNLIGLIRIIDKGYTIISFTFRRKLLLTKKYSPVKTPLETLELPVIFWLSARTRLAGGSSSDGWQVRDPVIRHLASALWVLERNNRLRLGPRTRQAAARAYLQNHAQWLIWERRQKELQAVLQKENVSLIPLKGVILKSQLYGDYGLRDMADVDMLVQDDDFWEAAHLLGMVGMKPQLPEGIQNISQFVSLPRSAWPFEINFRHEDGLSIDLHRHLLKSEYYLNLYNVDMRGIWARSIPVDGSNENSVWSANLSPYDMLAHLCLHQALHGLQAMHNYLDIDLYIRNLPSAWDWGIFINLIEQWQARSAAYHALMFSKYFMGTPIPVDIFEKLDPGKSARWRVGSLITANSLLAGRPRMGRRFPTLVRLALTDNFTKAILAVRPILLPDKSWLQQRYGAGKSVFWFWGHIWDAVRRGN